MIVTVLVLVVLTLGVLVFSATGFDSLVPVVAVEWLVVNRVPLTVDAVELGFLPLLPPLLYVAVLARQTRAVLADVEQPGAPEAGAAVAGATVTGVLLTALASLLMGSAASDFAVRESSLPVALSWSAAVGLVGSACGVWLFFRRALRERLPVWVRGGLHLGAAFVAATWAIAAVLVLTGVVFAWEPIATSLEIGKDFVGTAALTGISVGYLPNVVMAAAALTVGGEAHLGEASYSVFAVSRGPLPEIPLAAALPTTNPHWGVQGLLLVTVLVVAGLARYVAHWFRTTADAVRAAWLAAAVVALMMAVTPVVAGGRLGVLGQVGTGWMIASVMALLLFGIIGSATVALSLAGLTRRRERAEDELARRRRRAGVASDDDRTAAVPGTDQFDDEPAGTDPAPTGPWDTDPSGAEPTREGEGEGDGAGVGPGARGDSDVDHHDDEDHHGGDTVHDDDAAHDDDDTVHGDDAAHDDDDDDDEAALGPDREAGAGSGTSGHAGLASADPPVPEPGSSAPESDEVSLDAPEPSTAEGRFGEAESVAGMPDDGPGSGSGYGLTRTETGPETGAGDASSDLPDKGRGAGD